MATITRQLRINGCLLDASTPTTATVVVNGVEVFDGSIPEPTVGPDEILSVLLVVDYQGSETEVEYFPVSITVNSGTIGLGLVEVNNHMDAPHDWQSLFKNVNGEYVDDGRTNITIDDIPVDWAEISGREEPANWTGWVFKVEPSQTIKFDYSAIAYTAPPLPPGFTL